MLHVNKSHRILLSFILLLGCIILLSPELNAQCPMCRMSAESNLANGGSAGKGLNTGILYMLAAPYILIGTIGFLWWRSKRKESTVK